VWKLNRDSGIVPDFLCFVFTVSFISKQILFLAKNDVLMPLDSQVLDHVKVNFEMYCSKQCIYDCQHFLFADLPIELIKLIEKE
jgi:hypothetical protein